MRIKPHHRNKLTAYLKKFYTFYPREKYTIFHFVRFFKTRLKNKKDAWIGVSGETGSGKTLTCITAMILFGRPMTLTKNIAYIPKGKEITEMFDKLRFQCMLIDEAAREMRAVNWQSKSQQGVNVKAMTDRYKNNLVFLNMPNFNEFTKSMRRGNLQFRVIIPYRTDKHARIIVQRKSRNWRDPDPWMDEYANKLYSKYQKKYKEIDNEAILKIERSLPVTVMDFILPNLEIILPEITKEYDRLKDESRKEEKKLSNTITKDRYKILYEETMTNITKLLFYNKLGLGKVRVSKKEFAKALGISSPTFDKYLALQKAAKIQEKQKTPRENINKTTSDI